MKGFDTLEKKLRKHLPEGEFKNVSEQRYRAMSAVKGRDNKTTERRLRMALVNNGISGWRLHPKNIPGRPDFFFTDANLALFVDGCFWHQCPSHSKIPQQNQDYWIPKLKRNIIRAKEVEITYKKSGWKVIRIWEHEIKEDPKKFLKNLNC